MKKLGGVLADFEKKRVADHDFPPVFYVSRN